ncbi:cysteine/glutathione ABC transporter ATP-binding protein/permease CydC [Pantoea sp. Mb-10]|uniref:heme ABC transporter ATP-binding protein/permease CydC n=1 Tax=unclassified Pantoea TaxID=2630326 RepID=UPI001E331144|nr:MULTISPECIES: cysteine/glutathione ABC transporter ATP-binding protein/permease CydC [unclassified Pantoea]MCE0488633.1 cysteine/glutathione ABC transporter ATP-binding protein/permease CydC [Pantoea sp. Mb-10]MCE0500380.1 cysteine/glutathione ABC transporter ATP-binding protein/permease CydC [Pantoea sp. Pb-8]
MITLFSFLRLFRRHPWRLALGIILAIATLLASVGLLALSGWFLAASSLAGAAGLYSFNYMLPAAGVRGAAIVRTAARYFERLVSHDATFRVLQHLRVYTFAKVTALAPEQLARFRQGDLLNRFVTDVDTLDHLYLRVLSPLIGAAVVIVVVTLGLAFIDASLALLLGGIMLATLLSMPAVFGYFGASTGERIAHHQARWRLQLTRWITGLAELQLFGAAAAWRHALNEEENAWQHAQRKQFRLQAMANSLLLVITGSTVTLLLWLSAGSVGASSMPGALIALFVFCALAAFEALAPVAGAFLPLTQVARAAERVNALISQTPAIMFPTTMPDSAPGLSVTLDNVVFHYPQRPEAVLADFSLQLQAGEHVALLGPTGCGKSTVLSLLTRGHEAQQGTLALNGIAINRWDEASLRQRISVVPQRVHLFNQSLRDNLLLARPDASDAECLAALHQVELGHLADAQDGLDAWMGEGGRPLSGGELRRLGIARAILHDGDLWLLDEPTEGLDATTEQHILTLLNRVSGGKTAIMVTHRLSGLSAMDRICVMDRGQIVESGTHHELISKAGRYWRFCQRFRL